MTESLIARTALGDLQGIQNEGVVQFRGVPYAEPPVGELRFAPPQPVSAWMGLRDARQHGPIAQQLPSRLSSVFGNFVRPQSEDCLTLTISTPALDGRARPVIVWLHGGAFVSGAGSLEQYDGATLAREGDLVVVSVNYRLGALGFLYQPGISNGRLGTLDMIVALAWVRQHIGAFGGDPHQVSVMGQSAGAHTIMCMLAMPDARLLFQRAILQSAPAGMPPHSEKAALEYGNQLLKLLDIEMGNPTEIAARLKAESPTRIIEATGKLARLTARFGNFAPPLMPVIDDLAAPERFIEAAAEGAGAAHIDLIIGTTREEAHAFLCVPSSIPDPDPAQVASHFVALTGQEDAIEHYRNRRPGSKLVELLSDLITDYSFLFPSLRLAESASKAGAHTWVYQFDWAPPGSPLKACHCLELPFVFSNPQAWSDAPMLQGTDPATFAGLSTAIRKSWTSFVHTGDPAAQTSWPQYNADSRQTMRFAEVIGPAGDLAGVTWRSNFAS
jgi:para-nitrobenzyl esterase